MIRLGHAPRTPIRVMGHDPIPQLVSVGHDLSFQLGALGHDPHPCAPPGAVPPFATCTLPSDAESLFVFIGYCRGTQRKQEFHTRRACFLFWAMAPIGPQILYMQGLWSCPFTPPRIRSVPLPFPLSLSLCVPLPLPLPLPLTLTFTFTFTFTLTLTLTLTRARPRPPFAPLSPCAPSLCPSPCVPLSLTKRTQISSKGAKCAVTFSHHRAYDALRAVADHPEAAPPPKGRSPRARRP